ncbi:MAG: hypothetical protein HN976_36760 [Lentisphaerae bacterium]|jgi:hypothetical protein|nr:hypothetical protein [Lentisphaerota bacterium]
MAYSRNGVINRVLDGKNLDWMRRDMEPLLRRVRDFRGELLIFLRDNSFNIYYRGNSLAHVAFPTGDASAPARCRVTISGAFVEESKLEADPVVAKFDRSMSPDEKSVTYSVTAKQLMKLLKKDHITDLCARIKKVDYSEELAFEQKFIADNMDREDEDFVIMDRQVVLYDKTGGVASHGRRRLCIDMLGIEQVEGNQYRFVVIEAKMGSNPELNVPVVSQMGNNPKPKRDVVSQLNGYVDFVERHTKELKSCYEENYRQQKLLKLFKKPTADAINIVDDVRGMVIVSGYSGQVKEKVDALAQHYPTLDCRALSFSL